MPIFEVKGPDGTVYELDAPDQRSVLQAIQHMNFRGPAVPATAISSAPASAPRIYEDAATDPMGNATGFGSLVAPQPASGPRFRGTPVYEGAQPPAEGPWTRFQGADSRSPRDLFTTRPPRDLLAEQAAGGAVPPPPPGFVLDEPQGPWTKFQRQGQSGPRFPGTPVEDPDAWWKGAPLAEPAPPQYRGIAQNAASGLNDTIYGIAGAPVDLTAGAMNLGIRGANYLFGSELPTIDDPVGGSRSIGRAMGAAHPVLDPANTIAETTGEKIARGVGQGVAGSVVPAGLVGAAARGGLLSGRAATIGTQIFGRSNSVGAVASDAALGAASGGGGAIGQELAPEGWGAAGGLVGGILGGGLGAGLMAAGGAARRAFVDPFTSGGRERLAGEQLAAGASDPRRVWDALTGQPEQLVPGSQPTTFQRTGDLGLGVMEKAAANRSPERFAERRGDQNAARVDALRGIEPAGAPERVTAAVRSRLDAIDAETEQALQAATTGARTSADAIGAPLTPEAAGTRLRGSVEAARGQAKARERELWSAVDPDGSLVAPTGELHTAARGLAAELPASARPPSGEEAAILGVIGSYGEAMPFREVTALRSRLGDALREERRANGESAIYRRLSILRAGLERDLEGAISRRVAQEAEAVAAGTMRQEQTLGARVQGWREGYGAGQQARAGVGGGQSGPVGYAGGGSVAVPGLRGTEGEAVGGFGGPSGDPRLQGGDPGQVLDPAARERLTAATGATRDRVQTFDNATLRPFRDRPDAKAAGELPRQVFKPGPGSAEAIGKLRAAIGPEAADEALQGYVAGEVLRVAGKPDGTLDPARLAAWRRSHANALRAMPDLDARLSDAGRAAEVVGEVAAGRKAASTAARKEAFARLAGVDTPEDAVKIVGGLFSRQDAAAQLGRLRQAVAADPQAAQGLRRAVLEHITSRFVGNAEVATSGVGGVKADGFQTFVRQNRAALEAAGFSADELATLDAIAADLQRSGRSISGVKNPGGSDTAQNLFAGLAGETPFRAAARLFAAPGGVGIGVGATSGTLSGLAAGAAVGLFSAMRSAGMRTVQDLVDDALLNPERARLLLEKVRPGEEASRLQALARAYGQAAARELSAEPDDGAEPRDGRRASMESRARVMEALNARGAPQGSPMTVAQALAAGSPPSVPAGRSAIVEALRTARKPQPIRPEDMTDVERLAQLLTPSFDGAPTSPARSTSPAREQVLAALLGRDGRALNGGRYA